MKEYIGLFDSGIGGLTVVKSILQKMPNLNILYLGDSFHMPYGNKTKEEIISYCLSITSFLNAYPLKAMVIACNTADSIASKTLKERYELPIFGVVKPACRKASLLTKNKKIGVLATIATTNSKAYEKALNEIDSSLKVYSVGCYDLASLVEEGKFTLQDSDTVNQLNKYLAPLKEANIDTLILGCTHYPLLSKIILSILPNVNLISSSDCAAEELQKYIQENPLQNQSKDRKYFVTSDKQRFLDLSKLFMGELEGSLEEICLEEKHD